MAFSCLNYSVPLLSSSPRISQGKVDSSRYRCRCWVFASSEGKNKKKSLSIGDRLLDYIEGGPKLRKWYGVSDQNKRELNKKAEEENDSVIRDAVLIIDCESELGQLVVLSLIVKRVRIKVLVKDPKKAISAFGSYIEAIPGDISDKASVRRALQGVFAIICTQKMGTLLEAENLKGIEHIVYLSQLAVLRGLSGLQAVLSGKAKQLAEAEENNVINSGVPYTIVRAGKLSGDPGGQSGFNFRKGCACTGKLSREDAATICVEALDAHPQQDLIFEVVNGEERIDNWKDMFLALSNNATKD